MQHVISAFIGKVSDPYQMMAITRLWNSVRVVTMLTVWEQWLRVSRTQCMPDHDVI